MAGKHYADVLVAPKVSEKSNDLMIDMNQYTFIVAQGATKTDVRRAIMEKYGVTVTNVSLINLPRKPKRFGRHSFMSDKRRKAVIKLAEGDRISDLTEAV
jgi:large subunit ribosomal protein L23